MNEKIEFLSAVLLVSKDAERLATFYRDVIGIPLEDEQHGETHRHYGCELGDLHFAIHPTSNFAGAPGVGSVKLAFTVFDLKAFVDRVKSKGVKLTQEPQDRGFAIMATIHDPDGNEIEFTQLSDRWFKHLAERREKGIDLVARWQSRR